MKIRDEIIEQFSRKNNQYIGTEIEMPLVNLKKQPVEKEIAISITDFLAKEFHFFPKESTMDGITILSENEAGDIFSFDTTLNTVEFSLKRGRGIEELADRFYAYMEPLQDYLRERDYRLCGMGSNPYAKYASADPLKTQANLAKSQFLREHTSHGNGEIFHAFCASTQTHIDVNKESLAEMLNLFNKINFVNAYLFSNSLPSFSLPMEVDYNTICFRDILWSYSEAPNTGLCDMDFHSLEEIENHLMSLQVFIVPDGFGGVKAIKPITLRELYQKGASSSEMQYFRSLEYVAPNRRGTLEIRSDCTGPLYEVFAPVAFNVGIAENYKRAEELVNTFLQENKITLNNSRRRQAVTKGEAFVEREVLRKFVLDMVRVSMTGLLQRGRGEEWYIGHLSERARSGISPAQEQKKRLEYSSIETIIDLFSSLKG